MAVLLGWQKVAVVVTCVELPEDRFFSAPQLIEVGAAPKHRKRVG